MKQYQDVYSSDILYYSKCSCGAITITTEYGEYSCEYKDFHKYFPNVDLRKCKKALLQETYSCNYCVNHYGIDLCSCGSGEKVGRCDCNSTKPMQKYGQYDKVIDSNSWLVRR